MRRQTSDVVTRLDRVIQYAAALMLKRKSSAILGRPVKLGDDSHGAIAESWCQRESGRRHIVGVLDASTSPPKERYAVSNDNVIQLIQPGIFDDQLTEACATGHVPFSPRRSRPRSRTFSASMPI